MEGICHCGSAAAMPPNIPQIGPEAIFTPNSLGNCLTMMVTARPKANPRNTGREMNPDRLPRRNSDSARKITPTKPTNAVASASFMAGSTPAAVSPPIDAAKIAAEDDVGDTTAKRLRPASA